MKISPLSDGKAALPLAARHVKITMTIERMIDFKKIRNKELEDELGAQG